MQIESLEVLEKADVAPPLARAIVRAIEIEISGAKDTLATKHDLSLLREDVRGEIVDLRDELKRDLAKLESRIHETASSITRQMNAAVLGQMAVLLGFACFFATHVR